MKNRRLSDAKTHCLGIVLLTLVVSATAISQNPKANGTETDPNASPGIALYESGDAPVTDPEPW